MTKKSIETVDVCGVAFEVIERDASVVSNNDGNFGAIECIKGKMYLNGTMAPAVRDQTLIHEWLHGVLETYHCEQPEPMICALASELYRNNFRVKLRRNAPQITTRRL